MMDGLPEVSLEGFPDDVLHANSAVPNEKKAQRLEELRSWVDVFVKFLRRANHPGAAGLTVNDFSLEMTNSNYWELMDESVKPKITPCDGGVSVRADRHKIASLTELLLVHYTPLQHESDETATDLNIRLAYFCALNIIANFNESKLDDLHVSNSFAEAHFTWLRHLATADAAPIFANAANWYLVELIARERQTRAA